jgi:regulator of sigma E protease
MNALIFIIVLGILVFVHELGHFLFAKLFGIKVEEFGFGYPPRALRLGSWRGTEITLNWIPFGGFVKIFGENDEGEELTVEEKKKSLVHKPRWQQFFVMFGGILFNLVFAWVLISLLFVFGAKSSLEGIPEKYQPQETSLTVTHVVKSSPAEIAGLKAGDEIKEYFNGNVSQEPLRVEREGLFEISDFVNRSAQEGYNVSFVVLRGGDLEIIQMIPEFKQETDRYAIGAGLERVGVVKLPLLKAFAYGAESTLHFIIQMAVGFWDLITGKLGVDNLSGPVGIAGQVGDSLKLGFSYLVLFTALLSLNLAVLNFVPFPALDGGRILIILIESIIRKRLSPKIVNWINGAGFILLVGIMLLVTVKDIVKLF